MSNGNVNNNNKNNTNRVRAVAPVPLVSVSAATSSAVYDIPFSSIIEAWLDYEVNKRSSNSCLKFRWHVQRDLKSLWLQMISGDYTPGRSMVFMAVYPVLREIWAGASRDRVVHHWEALRYNGPLENYFVWVGDKSMNCRKGYGSLRAVETFQESIREFTENYTRDDCYIVGGDFKQFFPSINKTLAYSLMEDLLVFSYDGSDLQQLLAMLRVTIHHRQQDNYFNISDESLWDNYPKTKSLFHAEGFAPGNLISQHVANLLGAVFTLYMVFAKKAQGFIIFVDDWKCLVRTPEEGRQLIADASEFLKSELGITLHPDKIYLQHYSKGTPFVGSFIKPGRCYISNRTRGHFMHLTPRSQSPPRATARIVPCLCALRSALSTASPPHEVNKEQADTALRAASACTLVAVPHAVKSAEVRAATHECNIAHPQPKVCIIAHPACIFRKIAEGRANSLHRTDGGSSYAKRGKIPL